MVTLISLVFSLSREKSTFMALLNPEKLFDEGVDDQARLEARKRAIIMSLNEDISVETRGRDHEDNRLLARLDRLWRSVKRYVSPQEDLSPVGAGPEVLQAKRAGPENTEHVPSLSGRAPEEIKLEDVLPHIFSLLEESVAIREPATERAGEQPEPLSSMALALKTPATIESGGSSVLDELLYNLEPRDGVRTRGVAWRVHPNLTLGGTLDTTREGQVDGDLRDFGFRSMHALTFLRDMSRPLQMSGYDRIDSGYPRSYGLGLHYRLTPAMQMLFDYSHEYPSDHLIEYRGDWESSLLTDYTKKRPGSADGYASIHNFFFGLRYLHRLETALLPVHTGFFYSTNMADESLPSDVSMGFSLGGGYQKNALQVGVSYRLRIWETPEEGMLMAVAEEDLRTRMSNQVLFFIAF